VAQTAKTKHHSWVVGRHYCIDCGVFLDDSNTKIGVGSAFGMVHAGNGILCSSCHQKEWDRDEHGHSHFSLTEKNGLNPQVIFYCEDCGVKMSDPGVCKCDQCKEELRKYLS